MFDIIAPKYDRFTRVFSYYMDAGWKGEMLSLLPALARGETVADLASGTGDIAHAIAAANPGTTVVALDASSQMLAAAAGRAPGPGRPGLVQGDMCHLPLGSGSVRAITAGYGFRNVPDWRLAVAESARVLRPGGVLLVLDFYRPANSVWRFLFLQYLRAAGNVIGWLWHGEGVVYGYIAPSIEMYVDARTFADELRRAGLVDVEVRTKLFGGVALHRAVKPPRN
jgi:demethylmenaquinone methyltransferase / 2-methoxy-6-polyprenyl-1,4-benzoquinol methylase